MNFPQSIRIFHYRPAAWLRIAGPDAETFLQGQFSNDILLSKRDGGVYGLWLDHKGKVLADGFLVADSGGGFRVGSYFSGADGIRRRLEEHIIADDVTVEDFTGEHVGVALVGEGSGAWLASEKRAGWTFRGRRASVENWEWVHPASEAAEAAARLSGFREGSAEELERIRIASGIPAVPADIGPRDLPQEGGLEAAAVSYSKGCYIGQEVMARLKSRGRARRLLVRVGGRGPVPILPAELWRDGRKAGELRSAIAASAPDAFAGMAMLSVASLQDGPPFSIPSAPSTEVGVSA